MKNRKTLLGAGVLLATVATALIIAGGHLPSVGPRPTLSPSATPSGACRQPGPVGSASVASQAADGSFVACIQVPLGPSNAVISAIRLEPWLNWDSGQAARAGDWLTLTPASGPPGTEVKISGHVGPWPAVVGEDDVARICWASCDALQGSIAITWSKSEARRFDGTFRVPAAPWFSGKTISPLQPGRYAVIVPCLPLYLDRKGACATARLQAFFDLSAQRPSPCAATPSCARLQATPMLGPPGSLVSIEGWAPLAGIGGSGFVEIGFEPEMSQILKASGNIATPPADMLTSMHFSITRSPDWATLPTLHPVSIQRTGMDRIGVDPGDPRRFAYCGAGSIHITRDGGSSWTTISDAGVEQASAATDYPLPNTLDADLICNSVALDRRFPTTIYASFVTSAFNAGSVAYVSRDGGASWQPVPFPADYDMQWFGGFRVSATSVEAIYYTLFDAPGSVDFIVEQTTDGGRSWHSATLPCPDRGPCLALGALPHRGCSAHDGLQPTLMSRDSGRSWMGLGWPDFLNACSTAQLIGLADDGVIMVDPLSPYALRVTLGGHAWLRYALPPINGAELTKDNMPGTLEMLSDGRLLIAGRTWYLLVAGARSWCTVPLSGVVHDVDVVSPMPIGGSLWWIDPNAGSAPEGAPRSIPLSRIHC